MSRFELLVIVLIGALVFVGACSVAFPERLVG